jgi:hypothetical protein
MGKRDPDFEPSMRDIAGVGGVGVGLVKLVDVRVCIVLEDFYDGDVLCVVSVRRIGG